MSGKDRHVGPRIRTYKSGSAKRKLSDEKLAKEKEDLKKYTRLTTFFKGPTQSQKCHQVVEATPQTESTPCGSTSMTVSSQNDSTEQVCDDVNEQSEIATEPSTSSDFSESAPCSSTSMTVPPQNDSTEQQVCNDVPNQSKITNEISSDSSELIFNSDTALWPGTLKDNQVDFLVRKGPNMFQNKNIQMFSTCKIQVLSDNTK